MRRKKKNEERRGEGGGEGKPNWWWRRSLHKNGKKRNKENGNMGRHLKQERLETAKMCNVSLVVSACVGPTVLGLDALSRSHAPLFVHLFSNTTVKDDILVPVSGDDPFSYRIFSIQWLLYFIISPNFWTLFYKVTPISQIISSHLKKK